MSSDVQVRVADVSDIKALASLRASWTSGADVEPDDEFVVRFRDWFMTQRSGRRFWIAWRGLSAIGMVNLSVFERMPSPESPRGAWGYLSNMFVREIARNKGVGNLLLGAVLDYATSEGLVRVVLNPSEKSRPFYGRAGFGPAEGLLFIRAEAVQVHVG